MFLDGNDLTAVRFIKTFNWYYVGPFAANKALQTCNEGKVHQRHSMVLHAWQLEVTCKWFLLYLLP